jgi:hypothetical protein
LLDVTWSAMRPLRLAVDRLLVDAVRVQLPFWTGGAVGRVRVLGLLLLARYRDGRRTDV